MNITQRVDQVVILPPGSMLRGYKPGSPRVALVLSRNRRGDEPGRYLIGNWWVGHTKQGTDEIMVQLHSTAWVMAHLTLLFSRELAENCLEFAQKGSDQIRVWTLPKASSKPAQIRKIRKLLEDCADYSVTDPVQAIQLATQAINLLEILVGSPETRAKAKRKPLKS